MSPWKKTQQAQMQEVQMQLLRVASILLVLGGKEELPCTPFMRPSGKRKMSYVIMGPIPPSDVNIVIEKGKLRMSLLHDSVPTFWEVPYLVFEYPVM